MPEFVQSVRVEKLPNGGKQLVVDGDVFPWHTVGGVKVKASENEMTSVTVTLLVAGPVTVDE